MKSLSVAGQIKATGQFFPVALIISDPGWFLHFGLCINSHYSESVSVSVTLPVGS